MMKYLYIVLTVALTVYGQMILKWRLGNYGDFPVQFKAQLTYFSKVLLDPFVISSFVAALLGSFTWIAALTKFDLSYAYPFMSLSFIFVLLLSYYIFNEPLTLNKTIGVLLIVGGLIIASRPN